MSPRHGRGRKECGGDCGNTKGEWCPLQPSETRCKNSAMLDFDTINEWDQLLLLFGVSTWLKSPAFLGIYINLTTLSCIGSQSLTYIGVNWRLKTLLMAGSHFQIFQFNCLECCLGISLLWSSLLILTGSKVWEQGFYCFVSETVGWGPGSSLEMQISGIIIYTESKSLL